MKKKAIITVAVIMAAVVLTLIVLYQIPVVAPFLPSLDFFGDPSESTVSGALPDESDTQEPIDTITKENLYQPGEEVRFSYSLEYPDKSKDESDWSYWVENIRIGKTLAGFRMEEIFSFHDDDRYTGDEKEIQTDGVLTSPHTSIAFQVTCRNNRPELISMSIGDIRLCFMRDMAVYDLQEVRGFHILSGEEMHDERGMFEIPPGKQITVELLYILPDPSVKENAVLMRVNLAGRGEYLRQAGYSIPYVVLKEQESQ